MKKLFIFFCTLLVLNSYSQEIVYKYHLYVKDYKNPPIFKQIGNQLIYSGNKKGMTTFFSNYFISAFYQLYPDSNRPINLRVFQLETIDSNLFSNLINTFPFDFEGGIDVTDEKYELAYYPNDYGNTNPNGNLGVNINRNDLDYINVKKAWEITTGDITIGISDARINITDADFAGKTTFINPYQTQFSVPFSNNAYYTHGTQTAGIAAAQGDNNHGTTGVCYNCKIKGTAFWPDPYPKLLLLAKAGVRVINMSWVGNYSYDYQNIVDEIVQDYNTVLVAAAGNDSSYQTDIDGFCGSSWWNPVSRRFISNITGIQYKYPASFNGVISVAGINHKNKPLDVINSISPLGFPIGINVRDSFSPNVNVMDPDNPIGLIFNGWSQDYCTDYFGNTGTVSSNGIVLLNSSNPLVDILAPGYDVPDFAQLAEYNNIGYFSNGGTSSATPFVSGTAALMISVNKCLVPNDVDVILKLTSKDVENMVINQLFQGQIGAGALNAGDAVEFVNEMKKINGNAVVDNHIFNRFDLKLDKINHDLTIQNIDFRDNCKVDFTVKNQIHLLPNTNLKPNTSGRTYLSINPNIDISCNFPNPAKISNPVQKADIKNTMNSEVVLFPNPNNGSFQLNNITADFFGKNEIKLQIYDLNGRILQDKILSDNEKPNCKIDLKDLSSGIYVVKLSSSQYSQDFKFIKK